MLIFHWLESSFHWLGLPLICWWGFLLVEISTPVRKFITTFISTINSPIIHNWISHNFCSVNYWKSENFIFFNFHCFSLNTRMHKKCMEFKML